MTKYGRIYIIRNTVNPEVYIGQTTVSIRLRFQNHLSAARRGKDYVIGKAIRKYGEDKFYVELLEECLVEELNERERYWIALFKSNKAGIGYNMSPGGNAVTQAKEINHKEVLDYFNAGIPAYNIAKILHVGVPRITSILKEHNISYGLVLQKIKSAEELEIVKLYEAGFGTMEICRKVNRDKKTVRKVLKSFGIRLRSKKETKNMRRNLSSLSADNAPRESCNCLVNN